MEYPLMIKIEQELVSRPLHDLETALDSCMESLDLEHTFKGPRIAVAVGSRSIDRIAQVVTGVAGRLKKAGFEPFIVPAMGSHGGATPKGQQAILERLGVTGDASGVPIEPSMETSCLGTTRSGADVFTARCVLEAHGIIAINRVGLHTGFSGPVQSGVVKMLAVGLGKAEGARALHEHGFGAGHRIGEVADVVLSKAPPVCAIAVMEDGTRKLSELHALAGSNIRKEEPGLLDRAASMWPGIPLREADLLIVEEIGKDISGIGMDPHVTGRGKDIPRGDAPPFTARRLVVLRLTPASGGNATGIGHADITTQAFLDATDRTVTYKNVLTSGALYRARVPLVAATERQAIEMALASLGGIEPERAAIVRIRNTRQLEELDVSAVLLPLLETAEGIRVKSGGKRLSFGPEGDLL